MTETNGVASLFEAPSEPIAALETVCAPEKVLQDAHEAAVRLREFLDKTGAVQKYGDNEHVMNEGWQFVAAMFGATPVAVGEPEHVTLGDAHGFKAKCELIQIFTGKVLGRGTAYCMTDEPNWRERPKYKWVENAGGGKRSHREPDGFEPVSHQQRASMAQTRASSKAMTVLKWVVKVAGYAPTPAEDMDSVVPAAAADPATPPKKRGPAISAAQWGRLWSIFKNSGKTKKQLAAIVGCAEAEVFVQSKLIPAAKYKAIVAVIQVI